MAYYVLATRDRDGVWSVAFSDRDKESVEFERDDMHDRSGLHGFKRADMKVLKVARATQKAVDDAVAALNGGK